LRIWGYALMLIRGPKAPEYRQVGFPLPCLPKIKKTAYFFQQPLFSKQRMASMKGGEAIKEGSI